MRSAGAGRAGGGMTEARTGRVSATIGGNATAIAPTIAAMSATHAAARPSRPALRPSAGGRPRAVHTGSGLVRSGSAGVCGPPAVAVGVLAPTTATGAVGAVVGDTTASPRSSARERVEVARTLRGGPSETAQHGGVEGVGHLGRPPADGHRAPELEPAVDVAFVAPSERRRSRQQLVAAPRRARTRRRGDRPRWPASTSGAA